MIDILLIYSQQQLGDINTHENKHKVSHRVEKFSDEDYAQHDGKD